jgi:heat shock protein HtpX
MYSAISANIWKSYLIMVLFIVFTGTVGYVLTKAAGYDASVGILIFIGAIIYSFISYFFSDKIVLATSGAKQIQLHDNPELFRIVENLSIGDGLPMPRVYVIHDASPNAFATGRDPKHAAIAVTTGIMEKLNKAELEGVLAHELSHVKNYDTRLLAITAVLIGFISLITDIFLRHLFFGGRNRERIHPIFLVVGIILAILAPIVATLMQLAISRKREFLADASGALLTRYPDGLANALEKISADPHPLKNASSATAHLYISNPLKKNSMQGFLTNIFSTHPPIQERVKILRSM